MLLGLKIKLLSTLVEIIRIIVSIFSDLLKNNSVQNDEQEEQKFGAVKLSTGETANFSYCYECAKRKKQKYVHPYEYRRRSGSAPEAVHEEQDEEL